MLTGSWDYYDVEIFGGVSVAGTFTHQNGQITSITLPNDQVIKAGFRGLIADKNESPNARFLFVMIAGEIERAYAHELTGPSTADLAEAHADKQRDHEVA